MKHEADLLYIGCYTGGDGDGEGIVAARRDLTTGALTRLRLAARTPSPSFLARHPGRPLLYAVSERPDGRVNAWRVVKDGALDPIGGTSTGGAAPCHLAVHTSGKYVISANYNSGSVSVNRLDDGVPAELTDLVTHTGQGPVTDRQEGPHAHMISVDQDGFFVHAVDLGADALFHYRFDTETGRLLFTGPTRCQAGSGPRHLAGHGTFRYVVGELDGSLTCYAVDARDGAWIVQSQVSLLAEGAEGFPSEVDVSPDGRFVYAAVRGPDQICVFAADAGKLKRVAEVPCGGEWPRHFTLVDQHLYVANQYSHNVVTFRVDPDTGVPEPTGNVLETPSPSCVFSFFPARTV